MADAQVHLIQPDPRSASKRPGVLDLRPHRRAQAVTNQVPRTIVSCNPGGFDYRQLRIMFLASAALLNGVAPMLAVDEIAEAGELLERLNVDAQHDDGCRCPDCGDEPDEDDGPDAFERSREIAALVGAL